VDNGCDHGFLWRAKGALPWFLRGPLPPASSGLPSRPVSGSCLEISLARMDRLRHHGRMAERDPQRKKILSYVRDHRNDWGNSKHASRRSVPARKAGVNRAFRHALRSVVDSHDTDFIDDRVPGAPRPYWQKSPDAPLGEWLGRPTAARPGGRVGGASRSAALKEAQRRLARKRGWRPGGDIGAPS
jgi:hypothetical protein